MLLLAHTYYYSTVNALWCIFAVDIWSVGCIMAELIRGGVMFPGSDRILCSQAITVIQPEALIYLKYIHLVLFL
mgnify:CR=1 FL=1